MEASEKIWHLIARSLNREISAPEQEELTFLLESNPLLSQQYELLTRIWNEKHDTTDDTGTAQQAIQRIINKANEGAVIAEPTRRPRRRMKRVLPVLTLVAIIMATGWWYFSKRNIAGDDKGPAHLVQQVLSTQKGNRSRYLLSDGTTVWLNAGSKLHCENDFSGATREVSLEGEAYFDVVRQESRPFIVHASGYNILVLGTVFNVKAYPEDKNLETTLLHGSVKVFRMKETESTAVQLKPNQKLVIPLNAGTEPVNAVKVVATGPSQPFSIIPIDTSKKDNERFETAWLYSRLEFRGDDFETLAHKLERWYNISISFSDEKVKQLHFNGSFEKETAEQAFMAMRAAVPLFNYKISNHQISISSIGTD